MKDTLLGSLLFTTFTKAWFWVNLALVMLIIYIVIRFLKKK